MPNQEQLQILQQSVEEWNQWRSQNEGIRPDLREANLSEANLARTDFSRANLTRANLTEAYLWGAILTRALLTQASLARAQAYPYDLRRSEPERY
jgi:uncharacterized protein YjbI with pentapeptide repeats